MKILFSILLMFLFAVCAASQTSSASPEVAVLEYKWRVDVFNPALEKDPLAASKAHQEEERQQQSVAEANENRARQGEPALPPVVRKSSGDTGTGRVRAFYIYELKVKNTGRQEIRTVIWEYVFFEPGTTQEVGRLRFVSDVSIKPGTTKHFEVHSKDSPTGTLNAAKAGKKPRDQYSEQIVIRSLEYADGYVWTSASK